jgi:RimJ/RimL family protein N-acetyltransferase
MNTYSILNKQVYSLEEFSIVPIRTEDRFDIMKWRNEQVYHLRQSKPLTEEDQENYFKHIISKLFDQKEPDQILFSYLRGTKCIGYGGLVHINWADQNAEISFIMDTSLEKEYFNTHWTIFLELLEQVAFDELKLHKIFTYAFDLRPNIYTIFENHGFIKEAELKEHCKYDGRFISVIIHGKFEKNKR